MMDTIDQIKKESKKLDIIMSILKYIEILRRILMFIGISKKDN